MDMFRIFSASVRLFSHDQRYINIILLSYIDLYNHFKVKNVRILNTLFLNASPILVKAHPM